MAVGRFVDYQPLPQPGAYQFRLDDGSPLIAQGPEAEALARMLEQSRPPMLAQAAPAPTGREDAAMGMSVPDVPMPSPMASQAPPPGPPAAPPAPQAPPSPTVPAGVVPAQPTGGGGGDQVGSYLMRPVYQPGRPGITREQLQAKAGQGVPVAKGSVMETEGGFEPSADYLEGQADLSIQRRQLAQEAADHAIAQAQQGEADAVADFAYQGRRFQEQQDLTTKLTERVRQDEAQYHQMRDAFRTSKPDPQRLFRAKDGGTNVAMVLAAAVAQGLGAFGAALAGTPNFAQQIINSAIDRDIAAQQDEIAVKGAAADNALSDLLRRTGDLDQAKAMLRTIEHDWVAAQRAQTAAAAKTPEIMQRAAEWDLAEQQRMNDFFEDYRRASLGKHTQRVSAEVAYPQAGSAGGFRAPNEKEIQARAKTLGDIQGLQQGEAKIAKTQAETAQTRAEVAAGPKVEGAENFNKARAAADSALETGIRLAQKYGYEVDPTTGEIRKTGKAAFPGRTLTAAGATIYQGADHAALAGELAAFGAQYARIANGGTSEPTPALIEALTPDATATDEGIRQRLQNGIQHIMLLKKNVDAGAPVQLRDQRSERKQEVNREAAGLPAQSGIPGPPPPLPAPRPL